MGVKYRVLHFGNFINRKIHLSCYKQSKPQPANIKNLSLSDWQSVIGLEIHAQIQSNAKLFSAAGTAYGASTNSQVSHFDAALPGTLPVINKRCVEAGVLTALSLGCHVNKVSLFDRKHYFYADMPAGYQITQQRQPLALGGQVPYVFHCSHTSRVEERSAYLIQLQLEQDSGKSLHDKGDQLSLIDLNRAGVGLMEIVTAPEFKDGDDAASFVRDLRDILLTVGTCDGKMQEGSLRVDANISVNRPGEELGTRTEVKNLNSISSLRSAINYEIQRQIQILSDGGKVVNETMSYDPESEETVSMRDKEKILDYRFMPEPNLPPLVIYESRECVPMTVQSDQNLKTIVIQELQDNMAKLPDEKRKRLMTLYGMSLVNAMIIVRANLYDLFEELVSVYKCNPSTASNFVRNNFKSFKDTHKINWQQSPLDTKVLADIVNVYHSKAISGSSVNVLLNEKYKNKNSSLSDIIMEHKLELMSDVCTIEKLVDEVLLRNPKMVAAYKKGKHNQLEVIFRRVMKKLEGKATSKTVSDVIRMKLEE